MRRRIVILGGGTGGTLVANRLRRQVGDAAEIIVIDRDDRHVYQPGLSSFRSTSPIADSIVRSRRAQLHDGIEFSARRGRAGGYRENAVPLGGGRDARLRRPRDRQRRVAAARGDRGADRPRMGREHSHVLHAGRRDAAPGCAAVLAPRSACRQPGRPTDQMPGGAAGVLLPGRLVLRRRGVRADVELVYATPLDDAFTKPVAARRLARLLGEKQVRLETEFATGQVDGAAGRLTSWDDREIPFDLLVSVPLHGGAPFIANSPGLGDELGFVDADRHTLQSRAAANVFAIGDATNVPTSKAGSVTHFEGETLVGNIRRFLRGEQLEGVVRRPHQLLHRDRVSQGPADRLQLRRRAAARSLPRAAPRPSAAA